MNHKFPQQLLVLTALASACAFSQVPDKATEVKTTPGPVVTQQPTKKTASGLLAKRIPETAGLAYSESKPLVVAVGSIQMLPVSGKITRVAVGSGDVISSTAVDSKLLVIAEKVGTTSLMIWTDKVVHAYNVQVVPKDLAEVRAKVDALLVGIPGVAVQQLGTELILSGITHKVALGRLERVLKDVPGIIMNVREDIASPYVRSVLFRLHFVEVKKSLIEKIGIEWSKDGQGPVFGAQVIASDTGLYRGVGRQLVDGDGVISNNPTFATPGGTKGGIFLGLATTIASRINLGISNGDIRVLASPELTAKSGGIAKLQVGGDVPIPVSAGLGAVNVTFKPYGVLFSIEPQIDADDVITAKVSTELSQIDPAVSVGGIPGFLNRITSTEISLKPGEMVALSGLVLSEMSNAVDRVPGLSTLPIFGRLFKSEDFRDRKTELIVLLEPEIISPGDGLAQQLKLRGQANMKDFQERVQETTKPSPPPPPAKEKDRISGN
jgi:pilus assembly protein CpaC